MARSEGVDSLLKKPMEIETLEAAIDRFEV